MRELKTQESERFLNFFEIVRKAAKKESSIFFVDCGEGRDIVTPELEGEDLSGWLIPAESADNFQKEFNTGKVSDKWNDFVCFAIWESKGGEISVKFKQF